MSEKVILDENFSPILITLGQYSFFIAHGKQGIDALNVFIHLIYTARRQCTNQVWAAGNYLKKGLSMGNDRVKRAKAFLKKHGFISYVTRKQENTGYNEKVYIRLNFIHTKKTVEKMQENTNRFENQTTWPTGLKSNRASIQPGGNRTEMLKMNNRNALNEQYKTVGKADKSPHQLVISTFYDLYQQRYNTKPTIDSTTGRLAKELLKKQDVETIISRLHLYFEKEHYFTKGGRDFKNFRYNFDKLATTIDKDLEEAMKEAEVC